MKTKTKEEAVTTNRMKLIGEIRKWFEEDRDDLLRQMLQLFAGVLMGAEVDQLFGAEHGARSAERVNHRNGSAGCRHRLGPARRRRQTARQTLPRSRPAARGCRP